MNENPMAKIIRELQQEVEALREQLKANMNQNQGGRVFLQEEEEEEEEVNEKLHESEKLITNLAETWENKLKKTERIHQERQEALEKKGISIVASGISVEKNKHYLVNLNADPCLNKMFVYYLKDITYVGRPDVEGQTNDIQLSEVGIESRHCILKIINSKLFLEPRPNARTCVNGSHISDTVQLRHGDQILWGFNCFFRVNCPKISVGGSESQTPEQPIKYNFAGDESSTNPIQASKHEEDKQMALEKQRQEYEKQCESIRNIVSPTTPNASYMQFDPTKDTKLTPLTTTSQLKIEKWDQEREDILKRSLSLLCSNIMKADTFAEEANFISEAMGGFESRTSSNPIYYNLVRKELVLNELRNDLTQEAIRSLEKQHEKDKEMALEKQRQEYEKQFQLLRNIVSPPTQNSSYMPFDSINGAKMVPSTSQSNTEKWDQERKDMSKRIFSQLSSDIMKADTLAKEANFSSEAMGGSEPQRPTQPINYNFEREELMLKELSNDSLQTAIQKLQEQHEKDKQMVLEKRRQEYEKQLHLLQNIVSPTTQNASYMPFDPIKGAKMTPSTSTPHSNIEKFIQEKEKMFKGSLSQLRSDIMKANTLAKEANFFSEAMGKRTTFQVTLQIPPQYLTPNHKGSAVVSEPVILVKRKGKPSLVWSVEKLEHKLIVMREIHYDSRNSNYTSLEHEANLFYETRETHNLIGVANMFLECLFHDVQLNYNVPIISQQGEAAGRLQVEISRVRGQFPQERFWDTLIYESSEVSWEGRDSEEDVGSSTITCRVSIKQATGLSPSLSHFVFCQYRFWGQKESEIVAPIIINDFPSVPMSTDSITFKFDHVKEYTVKITEDLIEHCSEGALSIEVWGHELPGFWVSRPGWEVDQQLAKARSLVDRWSELTKKIEFWVEIQELGDVGDYVSVEVVPQKDCLTGGVYQLRLGQQRRVVCRVKPVANSGTLPLICEAITSINIGSVCCRLQCQRQLDSYTEEDLKVLRKKWIDALHRRRTYLDQQIKEIINKRNKSERDSEREQSLVDQFMSLVEEKNAVLAPATGSNIPGAPADWNPPDGMETHVPVIFLDLNGDDFSAQMNSGDCIPIAGANAIIPEENCSKFFPLQIIKCLDEEVCAVASWDSSIHDNVFLNTITQKGERIYLEIKAVVRFCVQEPIDVVLRKRICVNVYKKQSRTSRLVKSLIGPYNTIYNSGVMYEIVSNIPKASEELEERKSLATMAANAENFNEDGETYIEKYTRGVTSVQSILMLDRLRQNMAVKELLQSTGRPLMRMAASVPNFSQLFDNNDTELDSFTTIGSSVDLSGHLNPNMSQGISVQERAKQRYSFQGPTPPY